MIGYFLKPKNNFIDMLMMFFVGRLVYQEEYLLAIIFCVVISFLSGFLESWYERKTNGTFTE